MAAVPYLAFELPMPPSVNAIWRKTKTGMMKSPKYVAWQKEAGWVLKEQVRGNRVSGPVGLELKFCRTSRIRCDLDNRLKGTIDLLVSMNVIDDDSLVQRLSACWVPSGPDVHVMVISTNAVEAAG